MDINQLLCFALYSTSRSMTQLYGVYLEELDLTYPQLLTLILLMQRDQQTVSELCAQLLLDTGTITPLLKRLESKGLLSRKRSKADERVVEIHLTKAGKDMQRKLAPVAEGLLCDLDMTPDQVAKLASKIHGVRNQIDKRLAERKAKA